MDVTVVGAGFVAATLADALHARGCTVTMVAPTPEPTGASGTTYAWLNSHRKRPDAYQHLNQLGLDHWRREFGPRFPNEVHWCGHTTFVRRSEHITTLRECVEHLTTLGYPATIASPSRVRDLPFSVPEDACCADFPQEGYCDARAIHAALMEHLSQRDGFTFIPGVVDRVTPTGVLLASGDTLTSDRVVVAAGNGSAALLESAGSTLPLASPEIGGPTWGFLVEARARAHGLERLITSDDLNVHPTDGDHLLVQALDLDREAGAPDAPSPRVLAEYGRRLAALLQRDDVVIERAATGHRVIPADGMTVAGPVSGDVADHLWSVVTHSGITLGPWLAAVIAGEIVERRLNPALDEFRPTRFARQSRSSADYEAPRRPGEQ